MPILTITQLHKVEIAKRELVQRGHTITDVSGGGPWRITYAEKPKRARAAKTATPAK